jgi:pimeloyl-ACP methyl ester carboxylesterase
MLALLVVVYLGIVVYAYWPYGDGIPVAQLATAEDKFVTVDDIQLRYRSWGEQRSDQPTLVLVHGFANSVQTWKQLGPLLADDYYVVALDLPGFGLSAKPVDHDYGNASQAQVITDFITALGLQNVVIGGHSMGGAHAVHVALEEPQVIGMLLFNPGIITTGVPPATQYFVFPLHRLAARTFGDRNFRKTFLASSYVNPDVVTEETLDEIMLGPRSEGYIEGVTVLMQYYKAGDEIGMLAGLKVPTLIIWGVEDRRKPRSEATELQAQIAGSKLVMIEEAGHYVHEEQPRDAAQAIIAARDIWPVSN